MTVRYRYLADPGYLLMEYIGRSTNAQQRELFSTIAQAHGISPFQNCVSDMSKLRETTITAMEMMVQAKQIKQALNDLPHPIKQALYAPTPMSIGISRMYLGFAEMSDNLDIQIFDDLQEAITWSGLSGSADELFDTRDWDEIQD